MYENSDFAFLRFGECFASDNRLKVREVCKRTCLESSFSKFEAKGFNFQDMYQDFISSPKPSYSRTLFQVIPDKENSRLNQNGGGGTLCLKGALRRHFLGKH